MRPVFKLLFQTFLQVKFLSRRLQLLLPRGGRRSADSREFEDVFGVADAGAEFAIGRCDASRDPRRLLRGRRFPILRRHLLLRRHLTSGSGRSRSPRCALFAWRRGSAWCQPGQRRRLIGLDRR